MEIYDSFITFSKFLPLAAVMADIVDQPEEQISPYLLVHPDLLGWPAEHAKKTWDQRTFDYDDISDERREELDRFGARCREGLERARNRPQWPPDNYVDSSDTDDGSRTPTGLLTPDREPRVALPPPSKPAPCPDLSLARSAARCAALVEAGLDEAALGPVEGRPVVDFHDSTKRYGASCGLSHDLWGTSHNTRFGKRRRSYLFALNDAGQPAVVTHGNDDLTCGLFSPTVVSLGLTKRCAIVSPYDPESLAIGKYEELRHAGLVTFSEDGLLDFVMDYLESPELKRITRGAKLLNPESEEFFRNRRKLRDAKKIRKGKRDNAQRIEKRGRRPRVSRKMLRR